MNAHRSNGFTLAELVVGLVFLAVVLGPFLLFVSRIQGLNSAIGQQARREAWRSFNDQVVAAGIDPGRAPGLATEKNAAIPAISALPVRPVPVTATAGVPLVVPLQIVLDATIAEPRLAGAGLQLGAGAAVAPLTPPSPPLPPIVMPVPSVAPSDGTSVEIASLVAGPPGEPFTMTINVASASGNRVWARVNPSPAAIQGRGAVQTSVTAVDLLNGVTGSAWTEYAGGVDEGDRAVQLDDGRTRWLVTTAEGHVQIYEPSPFVSFTYELDLGTPILAHGTDEVASGGAVALDYVGYSEIQNGTTTLRIDFPETTRNAFGKMWGGQALGFHWTFAGSAGPFSGNVTPFFSPDALSLWADSVPVIAATVVPPAGKAGAATWTLLRIKTALGPPVMSTDADTGGFYSPGDVEFRAPPAASGVPIGRLSFADGTYLSTATTLSITLIP